MVDMLRTALAWPGGDEPAPDRVLKGTDGARGRGVDHRRLRHGQDTGYGGRGYASAWTKIPGARQL